MVPNPRQGQVAGNGSLGGSIILPNPKKTKNQIPQKAEKVKKPKAGHDRPLTGDNTCVVGLLHQNNTV